MTKTTKAKRDVMRLMAKYDKLLTQIKQTERELDRACITYGKEQGYTFGLRKDHVRVQLLVEAEKEQRV